MLKNYLMVFFVSMVPVIELRGAIPIGLGMGLPALPTYLVCVLGNMLPVPSSTCLPANSSSGATTSRSSGRCASSSSPREKWAAANWRKRPARA